MSQKRAPVMSAHCLTAKQNPALIYFRSWRLSKHRDLRIRWCGFAWSQAHKLRFCSLSVSSVCVCVFTHTGRRKSYSNISFLESQLKQRNQISRTSAEKKLRTALLLNAVLCSLKRCSFVICGRTCCVEKEIFYRKTLINKKSYIVLYRVNKSKFTLEIWDKKSNLNLKIN